MLIFGREPAIILDAVKQLLILGMVFGLPLTELQTTLVMAALIAGFGAWKAFQTRPIAVVAVTDFVQAVGVLAIGFGVAMSMEKLATILLFVSTAIVLIQRNQIAPGGVNLSK
jgi:hypothetical protein